MAFVRPLAEIDEEIMVDSLDSDADMDMVAKIF